MIDKKGFGWKRRHLCIFLEGLRSMPAAGDSRDDSVGREQAVVNTLEED
jgi:hypothetical protein